MRGGQRPDRLPILGLLAVALALFWRALSSDWVFWQRDIHLYWYPAAESFVRVVAGGGPPLWNPFFSFGLPLLADPSYQVLYPFTWLNLLMAPATYYKVYVLVHVVAAGGGLYLLARRWGLSRPAAFVSGAVWMASGPLLVVVSHTHHFAGTALLPWVLLALETALASGTAAAAMLLGAVAALQVFAGSGDLCLMTAFIAVGRVLGFLAARPVSSGRRWRNAAVVAAVAPAFAAVASAAQWMPTIAILRSGLRLQLDPVGNLYWSLHPASLLDLFVFRLVADLPVNPTLRALLYESREPLFACIYLGAAAMALVSLGLTRPWRRLKAFCAAGVVLSLIAALGRNTLVYPALLKMTPLFLFRYPSKYVIAAGFFWAVLAGLAAEDWLRPWEATSRRRVGMALGISGAFAAMALAGAVWLGRSPDVFLRALDPNSTFVTRSAVSQRTALRLTEAAALASLAGILVWIRGRRAESARWAGPALLVLVIGDLVWHGRDVNPLAPSSLLTYRPEVVGRVPEGARLYSAPHRSAGSFSHEVFRGPSGWEWEWDWALGVEGLVTPPIGARWGLSGSYEGDFTGLAPPLLNNLAKILEGALGTPLGLRMLEMGGVEYVVTLDAWPELQPVAEFQQVFAPAVKLFRVPDTFSRAYVVGRARLASEPDSVYLIGDAGFDPRREVILPAGTPVAAPDPAFRGEVRTLWRRADGLGLATTASAAGYVVVLDTFLPGWTATVDGAAAEVLRANVVFRAVAVPAGSHTVTLAYRPPSVVAGLLVSGTGLLLGLAFWAFRPAGLGRPHGAARVDAAGATL
jgi:hypothetical protein